MDTSLLIDQAANTSSSEPEWISTRALLTVTGTTRSTTSRPPLALGLVIDRSGSMAGDRLHAARVAAARAVDRLGHTDVVSAVAFDTEIEELAPPRRRAEQHTLLPRLRELDARGSTNLSGGWLLGRRHLEASRALLGEIPGVSRRVVLITDGHANEGITDVSSLVELARSARASGITTTTIGIGDGYDDALLRAMADAGGGNAWYVERPEQAHDVLAEELGNLLSLAAQGLRVTLTLAPSVSIATVHSTWPMMSVDTGVLQFDLGDLYASEPKPLLLELRVWPTDTPRDASMHIATLTIRADVLCDDGSIEERTITMPINRPDAAQPDVLPVIQHAVLLARAAAAREEAARRQREGDGDGAATVMREASNALRSDLSDIDGEFASDVSAQADDLSRLAEQYETHAFSEADAKYQMQRSYNARRGKRRYDEILSRPVDDPR